VDTREDTISNIGSYYNVKPDKLRRQYKKHSSGYNEWNQKPHAEDYMLFPENVGKYLSIDEVSLSQGELYTFVTNKNGRGKKGTLVASIKGTRAVDIISVLEKLPMESRKKVEEVTLDMARNMESAIKSCFTCAGLVTDRFHVVKLAIDALQHVRIKLRWDALDKENQAIQEAKKQGKKYVPEVLENGDSPKQLLARSRYILAKKPSDWTLNQKKRAGVLFGQYPALEKAYHHIIEFRNIFENKTRAQAQVKLDYWIKKTMEQEIKEFYTVAHSVQYHLETILNFFNNRNTNANAESFNAKIKLFRANLRGVSDTKFFLFRMHKLFA
jgi:transposase